MTHAHRAAAALDASGLALELHAACMALALRRGSGPLRDQLHRASLSVVLRLAPEPALREARGFAVRVVQMSSRLAGPLR